MLTIIIKATVMPLKMSSDANRLVFVAMVKFNLIFIVNFIVKVKKCFEFFISFLKLHKINQN